MHSKVFVKLKKTLKPSRPGKKTPKNPKNPKKPKKPKKTHWAGFFKKKTGFFQPCLEAHECVMADEGLAEVLFEERGLSDFEIVGGDVGATGNIFR